jgi:TatD DNase family protein
VTLCDTHCHLNLNSFDNDRDEVLQRAFQTQVTRILVPGIDIPTSQMAIELAEKYPEIYAAIGIHPNSGNTWQTTSLADLRKMAFHPKVVAIGEIGLDYYRQSTDPFLQKEIFLAQLNLAAEVGKPVILHSRHALMDMIPLLEIWHEELISLLSPLKEAPGVLHAYEGELLDAQMAISNGFLIGIGGPITYLNAAKLQQTVSELPLSNLILETDAPFLTPHPLRGKRNEPGNIPLIAQRLADLRHSSLNKISEITTNNANKSFHWIN